MVATSLEDQKRNAKAVQRASKNLSTVLAQIGVGGKDGLADVGVEARNAVVRLLSTPGTGRVYRRRNTLHRASSPGAPPAVDEGKYRASWSWEVGQDSRGSYVDVGTNDKRGPWLEHGTRRMRPRPHVRPAVNEIRKKITALVKAGIVVAQRGAVNRLPKEVR